MTTQTAKEYAKHSPDKLKQRSAFIRTSEKTAPIGSGRLSGSAKLAKSLRDPNAETRRKTLRQQVIMDDKKFGEFFRADVHKIEPEDWRRKAYIGEVDGRKVKRIGYVNGIQVQGQTVGRWKFVD